MFEAAAADDDNEDDNTGMDQHAKLFSRDLTYEDQNHQITVK